LFDFKETIGNDEMNLKRISEIEADSFKQEAFVSSAVKKVEEAEEMVPDVSDTLIHPKV
jgi:hypothetical protein